MSLIKKADVKNHLSARREKTMFSLGPVSEPGATGYSGDEPRDAKVNASRSGSPVESANSQKKPQA